MLEPSAAMVLFVPFLLSFLMARTRASILISSILMVETLGSAQISAVSRSFGSYDPLPIELPQVLPPPLFFFLLLFSRLRLRMKVAPELGAVPP